jgi:hypothetical protein
MATPRDFGALNVGAAVISSNLLGQGAAMTPRRSAFHLAHPPLLRRAYQRLMEFQEVSPAFETDAGNSVVGFGLHQT